MTEPRKFTVEVEISVDDSGDRRSVIALGNVNGCRLVGGFVVGNDPYHLRAEADWVVRALRELIANYEERGR